MFWELETGAARSSPSGKCPKSFSRSSFWAVSSQTSQLTKASVLRQRRRRNLRTEWWPIRLGASEPLRLDSDSGVK